MEDRRLFSANLISVLVCVMTVITKLDAEGDIYFLHCGVHDVSCRGNGNLPYYASGINIIYKPTNIHPQYYVARSAAKSYIVFYTASSKYAAERQSRNYLSKRYLTWHPEGKYYSSRILNEQLTANFWIAYELFIVDPRTEVHDGKAYSKGQESYHIPASIDKCVLKEEMSNNYPCPSAECLKVLDLDGLTHVSGSTPSPQQNFTSFLKPSKDRVSSQEFDSRNDNGLTYVLVMAPTCVALMVGFIVVVYIRKRRTTLRQLGEAVAEIEKSRLLNRGEDFEEETERKQEEYIPV